MTDALQLTVAGLSFGAIYGLIAVGYVAIFTVSQVINLAQGEFAITGAMVAIATTAAGVALPLALVAGIVGGGVLAIIVQRLVLAPIKKLTVLTSVILTLGASAVIKAVLLLSFGPSAHALPPLPGSDLTVLGVTVRAQELWIFGATASIAVVLAWFYDRTLPGKALRACAHQPAAARLAGISVNGAAVVAFAIAGTTAALAGILSSPLHFTAWDSGLTLGLKGFVAAAIAGLVSVRAAIVGGLLLGEVESLVAGYIDSGYRDAVAFVVLIVVLILRPQGIFGRQVEVRV